MIKSLKKFGGAVLLYAVIFFGIVAVTSRVNYTNYDVEVENNEVALLQK